MTDAITCLADKLDIEQKNVVILFLEAKKLKTREVGPNRRCHISAVVETKETSKPKGLTWQKTWTQHRDYRYSDRKRALLWW
jgi:hypothetical protein